MNIDEMQAGREMDALVAEKVMGWTTRFAKLCDYEPLRVWSNGAVTYYDDDLPRFSTYIAAAWMVVEKFKADGAMFSLDFGNGKNGFSCYIRMNEKDKSGHSNEAFATADTAPLAICRAALKVMEVH